MLGPDSVADRADPMHGLSARLCELSENGLLRKRRVLESPQGVQIQVDGRRLLAFSSNDYLGLAADSRLIDAFIEGARRFGVGAGASHLVGGHHRAHDELEQRLAAFVGMRRALYFSSGYAANLGVISAMADSNTEVFADRLNHASLNDGMLLSHCRFHRYPHLDINTLESMLRRSRKRRKIVVTDAVFSMDGDLAPLDVISQICLREGAWLVVDDAHGFGVLGAQGRGSLALMKVSGPHLIYIGTLGKAAGVAGAFVAAANDVVETLVQSARTYIYTTALPPALAHALLTSLDIIEHEEWRRERLVQLISLLGARLSSVPFALLPSKTPIQPIIIGEAAATTLASAALERRGIFVPAIRPPTVAAGSARLRVSLSAAHSPEDVEQLAAALLDTCGEGL